MSEAIIKVHGLCKTYRVPHRGEGLVESVKSLFHRTYQDMPAVQDIHFSIHAGEMVGFIGPNGAGKTTTLKMLAGLLHPSKGKQPLPVTFRGSAIPAFFKVSAWCLGIRARCYGISHPWIHFVSWARSTRFRASNIDQTLDELVELLDMSELLSKPVRNLSLGERMKCELVAGLLHRPKVMFLDEPTLGLDVSMQTRLRQFLKEYNQRTGATMILTSHYMADVTTLCPRVILIHHGQLIYDGELGTLSKQLAPFKIIRFSVINGRNGN